MKAKPSTKEQLIYFLYNHISLGTYDKKFINNLVTMYVAALQPVTSNQSALLDKITLRYERQLRKEEIDASEMVQLPWNIQPVESLPNYTQAHIDIKDDLIEVRSPFKSEFIKDFKKLSNIQWVKETKTWKVSASESTLKNVIQMVDKHYETVNYCDETKNILNTLETYKDAQYWNPTLVKSNGLFYISATTHVLDEAIKDIELNDSLSTLARLAFHGITISRSVLNDIPKEISDDDIVFAVERDLTLELSSDELARKLNMIGADYVLMREWNVLARDITEKVRQSLLEFGIHVEFLDRGTKPSTTEIQKAKLPVLITGYSFATPISMFFAKTIGIKNSTPIIIK